METIVGVVQDLVFGPLLMFGMSGIATELLGDRSFRILPVTDVDAAELVRSLRSSPLLLGDRFSVRCSIVCPEGPKVPCNKTFGPTRRGEEPSR